MMKIDGAVSVGVANVDGQKNRVILMLENHGCTVSAGFARHIAVQLIMTADYIDRMEKDGDGDE